jgi:hypothetical protein
MKRLIGWLIAAALAAPVAAAQQSGRASSGEDPSSYTVKTIPLRHLGNTDAVMLLTPYITGRGGVYAAGQSIHAVTVRGSSATIAEMERLLAQYDRSPVTVSLNFQLIAADYTNNRDPALAGLDSVLRSVLKFSGYHLMRVAVVNVSEGSSASQTLSADGNDYRLSYDVTNVTGTGADATIHIQVDLQRIGVSTNAGVRTVDPQLLATGVTIPIGHTVVLGSTTEAATAAVPNGSGTVGAGQRVPFRPSPMRAAGSDRALILTVRPQVAPPGKD